MICLLQQDDCAPDSLEYFNEEMKRKFGLTIANFHNHGKRVLFDDGFIIQYHYKGYILSIQADDPYYILYKDIRTQQVVPGSK